MVWSHTWWAVWNPAVRAAASINTELTSAGAALFWPESTRVPARRTVTKLSGQGWYAAVRTDCHAAVRTVLSHGYQDITVMRLSGQNYHASARTDPHVAVGAELSVGCQDRTVTQP